MEAFKQCCGNVPHYIVSIIVIILTLLFYGLQIALVFLLFPVTPNGMIVAYASPGGIILGRFPGIWKILALFVNFGVAILNLGAYALLLYLLITNNTKVEKQTRVPWWAAYLIFGLCFVLASLGSLIMGIDDCRWYIRERQQSQAKNKDGKYSELPNPGDNDDEEL